MSNTAGASANGGGKGAGEPTLRRRKIVPYDSASLKKLGKAAYSGYEPLLEQYCDTCIRVLGDFPTTVCEPHGKACARCSGKKTKCEFLVSAVDAPVEFRR